MTTTLDTVKRLYGDASYPSARALLEAGWSCRSLAKGGWAVYWVNGGELTFYPGDEGPQEASDIDEIIAWIGGDQPARLTPASLRRFAEMIDHGETFADASPDIH